MYPIMLCILAMLAGTSGAHAQLGGFGCPLDGKPQIRQGDSEAKEGGRFNSNRGGGNKHGGLDLNSKEGVSVKAALRGKTAVANPAWDNMGGTVIIDHGEGAYTVYGHLGSVKVKEDDVVKKGDVIGTVG